MSYLDSWLWQTALVLPRDDAKPEEQEYFRQHYTSMREKAEVLVGQIAGQMGDLTVHNVGHLDALWEMGSVLSENSVQLNPPEAFVFGGAVLLHDAAMSLAAFQDGIEGLKSEVVWRDAFARLLEKSRDSDENFDVIRLEKLATAEALRRLHASQAEKLPTMSWGRTTADSEYLIFDHELRTFYGPKIGRIAHSHWWSVAKLEEELVNDLGALGGRTTCRIDLVKIACLLRASDAMHIDRRRAPNFLRQLLHPEGISASHWAFQERLAVPFVFEGALQFSSSAPFGRDLAEAWWLAFDAVNVVDRELREIDRLFQRRGVPKLRAGRVAGAGLPNDLARYLETEGWTPVEAGVRITDVPKIVSTLGGNKLYGDKPMVAIRELLQNASDAIAARRILQDRPSDWGRIKVSVCQSDGAHWLCVEDNGVGMSPAVLTGPLIDFGNSFWRSPFAAEEFPGIQAAGLSATGKYGIGFFSVFMLGSNVRVTSRRYDKASDSMRTLEFTNGLSGRPILYNPKRTGDLIDAGTIVEVRLDLDPFSKGGLFNAGLSKSLFAPNEPTKLSHMVGKIAPALQVELIVVMDGVSETVIKPNDWLGLDEHEFCARLVGADPNLRTRRPVASRLRILNDEHGTVFGRAMIETNPIGSYGQSCISVGGFRATELGMIRGILVGAESTAARDNAFPLAPPAVLAEWATEQAKIIVKVGLNYAEQARAAQVVLMCGGDVGRLVIARLNGKWLDKRMLTKWLSKNDEIKIMRDNVHYDEDYDPVHPKDFSESFKEADNIIFVSKDLPSYYENRDKERLRQYIVPGMPAGIIELVGSLVERAWRGVIRNDDEDYVVGFVNNESITHEVISFSRA